MYNLLIMLSKEKGRRIKKFCLEKPFVLISGIASLIYLFYCYISNIPKVTYFFTHIEEYYYVNIGVLLYLILKIINPTQGIVIDYQLIQMKIVSLKQYKIILCLKLWSASFVLIILGLYFQELYLIELAFLNASVNIWIFLRNRFGNRFIDLFVALIIMVIIKRNMLIASTIVVAFFQVSFFLIQKLNYEEILPIYKTNYLIGQRFSGESFNTDEETGIKKVTESLIGKPKQYNKEWSIKYFNQDFPFYFYKEVTRVWANREKLFTYVIISFVVMICNFYFPQWFICISCIINLMLSFNYNCAMYESEENLFLKGFINIDKIFVNLLSKLIICFIINFIFCGTLVFVNIKTIWGALVIAFACSFFTIIKCFKNVIKLSKIFH